jgi:hypothetical protein
MHKVGLDPDQEIARELPTPQSASPQHRLLSQSWQPRISDLRGPEGVSRPARDLSGRTVGEAIKATETV